MIPCPCPQREAGSTAPPVLVALGPSMPTCRPALQHCLGTDDVTLQPASVSPLARVPGRVSMQ